MLNIEIKIFIVDLINYSILFPLKLRSTTCNRLNLLKYEDLHRCMQYPEIVKWILQWCCMDLDRIALSELLTSYNVPTPLINPLCLNGLMKIPDELSIIQGQL